MVGSIVPAIAFVAIIALSNAQNYNDCRQCDAFGIARTPNEQFTHQDGCLEYTCECACDGSWNCAKELTRNVCQGDCKSCSAGGETWEGGKPFQFTEGCYQYNCFCKCDGGWSCPKERTEDICNKNLTTGCFFCDVYGTRHQGNSRFKHVNGCIEYACTCNCDGSWECPGENAVDKCNVVEKSGCYYCNVDGAKYEGNTYFKHVNGCIEYDCVCNCDGSWSCPGDKLDRCNTNATTGCYYCQVDGYLYQGNSRFPLVRDCYLYQCECGCDGGWTCKNSIGQYHCDERGNVPQECKSCNIDGNIFYGDSRFFYQKGCVKYMCTCDCGGRFFCSGDEARVTCDDVEMPVIPSFSSRAAAHAHAQASVHASGARSVADGMHEAEVDGNGCKPCTVNSVSFKPNSNFELVSGCDLVRCQCRCDGTVTCPSRTPLEDCNQNQGQGQGIKAEGQGNAALSLKRQAEVVGAGVDTCIPCKHAGVTHESLSTFLYESDCWRYKCSCRCNGSYDCPSEDSKYICTGPVTCTKCKVSDSQVFEPNTEFQLEQGCFKFEKCKCNCDGGWNCEDGEYTCERCQGCRVDGKRYQGNTTFSLTRGCDSYATCRCGCDGKWSCDADGLKDLCGKCRKCKIGDQYFDGGRSGFIAELGCTRFKDCRCDCDGTFNCQRGTYTCSERSDQPVAGLCNDCVHGDRRFVPGQSFDYDDGCSQYRGCECKCGTTHCQVVTNTCGECRSCEINGTEYRGGTQFSLQSGCRLYKKCDCFCNSKWKCYGESAVDSCNTCRKCNVNNTVHEPFSRFTLDQNCWKYQCFCGCDGSTRCPSETVINTCNTPDVCNSCEVNGVRHSGNTHFEYSSGDLVMSCRCNCDGSYICFAEWIYTRTDLSISGSGIGTGGESCFSCNIEGQVYRGNSNVSIQHSETGIEMNCQCFCNGGYYCFGKQLFDGGCRSCNVFGLRQTGGASFDIVFNGLPASCQCSCDGSYICSYKNEVLITCLDGRCLADSCGQCSLKGKVFSGRSRFGTFYKGVQLECTCGCDGSYYCEGSGGLGLSCVGGQCTEVGCTSCNVFGQSRKGGSEFEIIYRGLKLNCDCQCGGTYRCVGSSLEVVVSCLADGTGCLPGTCTFCNVNGKRLAGGSTFRYDYNGVEMQCTCACDGSYYCQGRSLTELIEIACIGGTCTRIGCGGCNIFGENRPGETTFPVVYGGLNLQCKCSCNGDYICAGSAGQVIVTCVGGVGCLTSNCRQCIVNGRRYDGKSTFLSSYKGVQISCTCGCDGTSYCVGISTSIEVSCVGGSCSRIGCRECVIFGEEYLGSSSIDFIYNGLPVTCTCDCEGGYICRSTSDQNPVIVCRDGTGQDCLSYRCRSCEVDGKRIDGNSRFGYTYNGVELKCQCACDSSYYCTGVREKIELSCVGGKCNAIGCNSCSVYGREVPGVSSFQVVYVGLLLDCQCRCDGSYECFGASGSVFRCVNNRGTCLTRECQTCNYNGKEFAGNSVFTETYKGLSVQCTCGCDSSIFCVGEQSLTLTCIGGRCTAEGCQSCQIFGRSHDGISSFPLVHSGYMLSCQCDCSGSYVCQGEITLECRNGRGRDCLPQTCSTCSFAGNVIRGMDTFKYRYKEFDMSCTCGCDGNVYCNGVTSSLEIRCLGDNCSPIGCTTCKYIDREIAPFGTFNIIHQGVRLDCSCQCNGFKCTGGLGEVVIECDKGDCYPSRCSQCLVNGNRYSLYQTFPYDYNGIELQCECGCDGSSYCVGVRESIEISCIGGNCSPRNCKSCSVFGGDYDPFSDFSIVYQGSQLDCRCSCDTSYTCRGSSGTVVVDCGIDGRNCLPAVCRDCFVDGVRRQGRQKFPFVYENIDMECTCGCDGSSYCRGKSTNITVSCIGNNCSPVGCQSCAIFGEEIPSPSSFDLIYRGTKLGCRCSCDSSYVCRGSTGDVVLDCVKGRTCLPATCQNCVVDGSTYTSFTKFPYRYKDIDMRCECGCDGSSYCKGVTVSFEVSCIGDRCSPTSCGTCNIFGIERDGDSSFPMVYRGSQMQCQCNCDSSYRCVGSSPDVPVITCGANEECLRPRCRKCRVNNQRYAGGQTFDFSWRSLQMSCVCGCDGSYFCRGQSSDVEISCQALRSKGCTQTGGCRSCNIFGKDYAGGSTNRFVYQGYFMTCSCKCDSSYECIGLKDEVVTSCPADRNCLQNCRSCRVDGKTFAGNSVFDTVYQGKNMECTCGCDGSYFCRCKDDNSEISCNSQNTCSWVGCASCRSDGRDYQLNAEFTKVYDNIQMNCKCDCDGSYTCTGREVKITIKCIDNTCNLVGCRSCIDNGRERPYGSKYETMKNGKRHECQCTCDGTARCSEVKERVCTPCTIDGTSYKGHQRHRIYRGGDSHICDCYCDGTHKCELEYKGCRKCLINGQEYAGNTNFPALMEGKRVDCTCDCNGAYECRGDGIVCTSSRGCTVTCAGCTIEGATYKGGATHKVFNRRYNVEMDCDCQCGGSYECTAGTLTCTSTRGCVDSCSGCEIEGVSRKGGTTFKMMSRRYNIEMECSCQCGGNYRCTGGSVVCTQSGCRDTCAGCDIEGTVYKGGSSFEIFHRGSDIDMDCTCECGGTYECVGGSVTCTSARGCVDSCRGCQIEGKTHKGGTSFSIFHRGSNIDMACTCQCGGSYECIGGSVTCSSARGGCVDSCSGCTIEGATYKGGSSFEIFHRGSNMRMDCTCQCGGSFECRGGSVICRSSGCQDSCSGCEIDGGKYEGGTRFTIFHRGYDIEMNCDCQCGGSHVCRGVRYTESCVGPGCPNPGCRDCKANGKLYPSPSRFTSVADGVPVECTCDCGGNLACRGVVNKTCVNGDCDFRCRDCNVDGRLIRSKTSFTREQNGVLLDCTCNCDGGFDCRDSSRICPGPRCGTRGCRRCLINGKHYSGNTRFTVQDREFVMNCSCYCDGSHSCTSSSGVQHSCLGENCGDKVCAQCRLDGQTYSVDTRFRLQKNNLVMNCVCECDGAYRCFSITGSCQGDDCDEYGCSSCSIDGLLYKGGTEFETKPGTVCSCSCSGQFSCRSSSLFVTCVGANCGVGGCKQCNVDGQLQTGNRRFQFRDYGLFMQCVCNCDSSYICRGYQIIGNEDNVDRNCRQCEVNGQLYNGNTRFQVLIDNKRQECTCHCNGQHSCANVIQPQCRECVVGGDRYPSNSPFTLTRSGNSIQCQCGCSGDFVCEGRKDFGATIDGCRDCYIFGSSYKSEQKFTTDVGGIRMVCECFCSGGYTCQGYRAVDDLIIPAIPEPKPRCRKCLVGDQEHEGGSRFHITRGCFKLYCQCDCDGGWYCPSQRPEYTCDRRRQVERYEYSLSGSLIDADEPIVSEAASRLITNLESASGTVFGTGACRSCFLQGQEFKGNSGFTFRDGCLTFTCSCDCSGAWNCTQVEGVDCSARDPFRNLDPFPKKQCRGCTAFNRTFPPEQRFVASDECYRYTCMCDCDGKYECPRELTVKTCPDSALVHNEQQQTCRQCVVGGNSYQPRDSFTLVENCIRYTCKCACDGSYDCPGASGVRVCRAGAGSPGRVAGSDSRTVGEVGRTVVAIRPSNAGSVSGRGQVTGPGGYTITGREIITPNGGVIYDRSLVNGGTPVVGGVVGGETRVVEGGGVDKAEGGYSQSGYSRTVYSQYGAGGGGSREGGGGVGYSQAGGADGDGRTPDGFLDLSSILAGGGQCRDCIVNGTAVRGGRDFTFRQGCIESLCECSCDGVYVCPEDGKTDFCAENARGATPSKGCKVGNRVYNMNLFSYTENCLKYSCRCYKDGHYKCDPRKTRKVC